MHNLCVICVINLDLSKRLWDSVTDLQIQYANNLGTISFIFLFTYSLKPKKQLRYVWLGLGEYALFASFGHICTFLKTCHTEHDIDAMCLWYFPSFPSIMRSKRSHCHQKNLLKQKHICQEFTPSCLSWNPQQSWVISSCDSQTNIWTAAPSLLSVLFDTPAFQCSNKWTKHKLYFSQSQPW